MKRQLLLATIMVVVLIITGCQSKASYENISTKSAKQMIDDKKVEIIDVRSEEEFAAGHIPNAKLIPLPELNDRLTELNKDQAYLIVCRSGNRSSQASEILANKDFKSIYNMEKGMNDWTYDVEK